MSAQNKTNTDINKTFTDNPNGRRTKLDGFLLKLLMAVSTSIPTRSQAAVGPVPIAVHWMSCLLGLSPGAMSLCSWSTLRQSLDMNHWLKG